MFRASRAWVFIATALSGAGSLGCEGGGRVKAASAATTPDKGGKPSPETRAKAEPTPEIIAASERLLKDHADAPIGSEFPLSVGGQHYVGRIEEHDNPEARPGRPAGKHKGVTVYKR